MLLLQSTQERALAVVVLLAALSVIGTGPAIAKPKADLVQSGYSCKRVGVNFTECTKKDSTTYWCDDAGNCESKPRKRGMDSKAPSASEAISRP